MSTVQHRDGKKIKEAEVYRQHCGKPDERDHSYLGKIAGHLGYAQRPAQLVRVTLADNHLTERLQGSRRQIAGLLDGMPKCRGGIVALVFHTLAGDAEDRHLLRLSIRTEPFLRPRRRLQTDLPTRPDDRRLGK